MNKHTAALIALFAGWILTADTADATTFKDIAEAEEGALAAYGSRLSDEYRRPAYYVDKILKGVAPADLPIEQPTKFEFVINLKAAKVLGLPISNQMQLLADEVIE